MFTVPGLHGEEFVPIIQNQIERAAIANGEEARQTCLHLNVYICIHSSGLTKFGRWIWIHLPAKTHPTSRAYMQEKKLASMTMIMVQKLMFHEICPSKSPLNLKLE